MLKIPGSTSNKLLYLPDNQLGFRMKSVVLVYAHMATESLVLSLEDKCQLTRALTRQNLLTRKDKKGIMPSLAKPEKRPGCHTCPRQ